MALHSAVLELTAYDLPSDHKYNPSLDVYKIDSSHREVGGLKKAAENLLKEDFRAGLEESEWWGSRQKFIQHLILAQS